MLYSENLTSFSLDSFDKEALRKKIKPLRITQDASIDKIQKYVQLVKEEIMILNKNSVDIELIVEVNSAKVRKLSIKFKSDVNLMPHLCNVARMFIFESKLDEFKSLTPVEMLEISIANSTHASMIGNKPKACNETTQKNITIIRKLDQLFNCNTKLIGTMTTHGFYMEKTSLFIDIFSTIFDTTSVKLTSKAMSPDGNGTIPCITIELRDLTNFELDIKIYNHVINLSYKHFMESEISDLQALIFLGLNLRKIEVETMEEFRDHLLVEEMKKFNEIKNHSMWFLSLI